MPAQLSTDELVVGLHGLAEDVSREAALFWFEQSQVRLARADSERDDSNFYPIHQSGDPPRWDPEREAWVFHYSHFATVFIEYGTEPHEIRARYAQVLAFEWPDAPEEVREQFEATFPLVFFKRVQHPGTAPTRFLRDSREDTAQALARGEFT